MSSTRPVPPTGRSATLHFGLTADRDVLPDLHLLAEGIEKAAEHLPAADTGALPGRASRGARRARRRRPPRADAGPGPCAWGPPSSRRFANAPPRGRTCGLLVDSEPGQGRHTGRVARVSEADKARMRRQAEDLAMLDDDEPGSVERRRALLDGINALRAADGAEPFADEDEEPPELEFFRRARALGMARIDR